MSWNLINLCYINICLVPDKYLPRAASATCMCKEIQSFALRLAEHTESESKSERENSYFRFSRNVLENNKSVNRNAGAPSTELSPAAT